MKFSKEVEKLIHQLDMSKLPTHLGIIPDGNRRWAKKHGKPPSYGHLKGRYVFERILKFIVRKLPGIKIITIYAMSLDNFLKRSSRERTFLFKLFKESFRKLKKEKLIHELKVKVSFFGKLEMLPADLLKVMEELLLATKDYNERFLNFCICYDGREEISHACREIAKKVLRKEISPEEIDENLVKNHVYTKGFSPPDLIIRSGGEKRISSFLLYDVGYSEFYFSEKLWPEFDEIELLKAIIDYEKRERRFGK